MERSLYISVSLVLPITAVKTLAECSSSVSCYSRQKLVLNATIATCSSTTSQTRCSCCVDESRSSYMLKGLINCNSVIGLELLDSVFNFAVCIVVYSATELC